MSKFMFVPAQRKMDKKFETVARPALSMDEQRPKSFYSFSPKTTSISFPWPQDVSGVERIALSAQGDLQRVLSAFFARPITIALTYSNTFRHLTSGQPPIPLTLPNPTAIASASPESPLVQKRQVHLQCSSKTVCTATSTVRITSPEYAHLFLEEKYAIGQMFARMGKVPHFELVAVGFGTVNHTQSEKALSNPTSTNARSDQLWRKYKLVVADFECEILEEFPSRDMFVGGAKWLDEEEWVTESFSSSMKELHLPRTALRSQTGLILFLGLGFLLMLAFEVSTFFTGRSLLCSI